MNGDTVRADEADAEVSPPLLSPRSARVAQLASALLTVLVLGLGVRFLLTQREVFEQAVEVLRGMAWWAVALATVAQVASWIGTGMILKTILAAFGQRLSVGRSTLINRAAYSVGLVAGGMLGAWAATYRWIRGSGLNTEGALLSGWILSLIYDGALLFAAFFGLFYLLMIRELSALLAISFALVSILLGGFAVAVIWGAKHRSRVTSVVLWAAERWARIRRRSFEAAPVRASLNRLLGAWQALQAGGWRGPVTGALIYLGFDMLTLYLIFLAAGYLVNPAVLLAGYGLPLLLGKVPLLPGGVGVVESAMTALYTRLGVPDNVAIVVVFIYRVFAFWLPVLLGFLFVPYLQRVSTSRADQPRSKAA